MEIKFHISKNVPAKEEISREVFKYFELNENENNNLSKLMGYSETSAWREIGTSECIC